MILAVDGSALVAIARHEAGYEALELALAAADAAYASPVSLMGAALILVLGDGRFTTDTFRAWLEALNVTESQAVSVEHALDAYLRWGKGVHRAGLSMSDCFAYALARQLDAPLLHSNEDFPFTDVRLLQT